MSLQGLTATRQFKNPGIRDFGDTAALIALMDVVITVDTAVANLAGAMGANLWVLNRYDMCWRWQPIRTPWFPTARSYRQETPGAWEPLVAKIIDDLAEIQDKIAA